MFYVLFDRVMYSSLLKIKFHWLFHYLIFNGHRNRLFACNLIKGLGITHWMLAVKVTQMVTKAWIKTPFRHGVPGKDWNQGSFKRHPDVTLRTPVTLSIVRGNMLNETVNRNYFDDLNVVMRDLRLYDNPHLIWNIGETSVPLTYKPVKILGERV